MLSLSTSGPSACSRMSGDFNATRSISVASDGTRRSPMRTTSGARRMTSSPDPAERTPCPAAARSSSGTFTTAPAKRGTFDAVPRGSSAPRARSVTRNGGAVGSTRPASDVPANPSTTGPAAIGARENAIVRWQRVEPARKNRVVATRRLQQALRREPVGLGHQQIDADRARAGTLDAANEFREQGPRPWPLAITGKAALVDLHDDDRSRRSLPRQRDLVGIEPVRLQASRHARSCRDDRGQDRQECKA